MSTSIPERTGGRVFAGGLLIYVVSFFLVAVGPNPVPGYRCALAALALPITEPENPSQPAGWLDRVEFRFVSIKMSGLINVVFVLAGICGLSGRSRALFKALGIAVCRGRYPGDSSD